MILTIRDLNGRNDYYGDGFSFYIDKKIFKKDYYVNMYCKGSFFESSPSYKFKTKEDAEEFISYVSDNMNGNYPSIDIRPILKKLHKIN
jgi:hypothetical protein